MQSAKLVQRSVEKQGEMTTTNTMNVQAAKMTKDPFSAFAEEKSRSHCYPVYVPCCKLDWTGKIIKGGPRLVNYQSTYADHFQNPSSTDDINSTITPGQVRKKQQEKEQPGSSSKSAPVKFTVQPDGTTSRQYSLDHPLQSVYSGTYKFRWCAPRKPMIQGSVLTIGDPERINERQTTYSAHYQQKDFVSSEAIHQTHEHQLIDFGRQQEDWKTSTTDYHPGIWTEPVHIAHVKKDRNFSCIPKGDLDPERNRARMTSTSYKLFCQTAPVAPVVVAAASMTKSDVVLGPVGEERQSYIATTASEYPRRTAPRVLPINPSPGFKMANQETGPRLTSMQADYPPVKGTKESLLPERLEQLKSSNFPAHFKDGYFTTDYTEAYTQKNPIQNALARVPLQSPRRVNGEPRPVNYRTTYADHFQSPTSIDDVSSIITPVQDRKNQPEKKLPGSSSKYVLSKYTVQPGSCVDDGRPRED